MPETRAATALPQTRALVTVAAGATIEEVKSSHVAMISHPEVVTKVIETPAEATS